MSNHSQLSGKPLIDAVLGMGAPPTQVFEYSVLEECGARFERVRDARSPIVEWQRSPEDIVMAIRMMELLNDVIEVAMGHPEVESVFHEIDDEVLSLVLCAPGMALEQELRLNEQLLAILDKHEDIETDFFVSSHGSGYYAKTGMSVLGLLNRPGRYDHKMA